ncbi:hypothetical protein OAH07_03490 [Verrucomicrobia bacterium]|nr:hypothetical protein [Verrucomicrobiota bacterium]MDG1857444.1 hypothetical protein [Verrucomicrobiota bacterium]
MAHKDRKAQLASVVTRIKEMIFLYSSRNRHYFSESPSPYRSSRKGDTFPSLCGAEWVA